MHALLLAAALAQAAPADASWLVAQSTATANPIQRAVGAVSDSATNIFEQAKGIGRSLRRLAIQLGTGVETGSDIRDPFLPKGIDRLFEWDAHAVLLNDGINLQAKNLDLQNIRQFALEYRLKFDPYSKVGVGHARDEVYRGVKQTPPDTKYGFGVGATMLKDEHWGAGLDFDNTKQYDDPNHLSIISEVTTLTEGVSPLGKNDDKAWNTALLFSQYWTDVHTRGAGIDTAKHGPGFSVGPQYQLALDWWHPKFLEAHNIDDVLKPDRFQTSLIYNDSSIGFAVWTWTSDVRFYVTKNARLTLGFSESYRPGDHSLHFAQRTGVALYFQYLHLSL